MAVCELGNKHCVPCEGGMPPLTDAEREQMLASIPGWTYDSTTKSIHRSYEFKGFLKTMAFVNAIAWMTHQENHHPDMKISFNRCEVHYTTHAIGGVSENDGICAAKVDALFEAN